MTLPVTHLFQRTIELQATIVVLYLLSDTCAKSVCSDDDDFRLVQFKVPGKNKVTIPGQQLVFVCDGPSNHFMDVIDVETNELVTDNNFLPHGCDISNSTSQCYLIAIMSANDTDSNRYDAAVQTSCQLT